MPMREKAVLIGLALWIALPRHAVADLAAGTPVASTEPEGLAEIVVTAQKRQQSLQDVPISVSVMSAETLERASITDLNQLPQLAPALLFQAGAQPAFTTLSMRGVGSYVFRIGIQPAVSVVVDGIPMARTAETQGALGDIQRVEVLSGPQGTLFGRNSTGGVINVVRNAPSDKFEGYVDETAIYGRLGDFENQINAVLNAPLTDTARLRVYAFNNQNNAYITNLYPGASDSGAQNTSGIETKLAIDLATDVDLLLTADYTHDFSRNGDPEILVPLQGYQQPNVPNIAAKEVALQRGSIGQPFAINDYDDFQSATQTAGVTLDLNWRLSKNLSLKSLSSYRDNSIRYDSNAASTAATPSNPQGWDLLGSYSSTLNPNPDPKTTLWHYVTQELRAQWTTSAVDIVGGFYFFDINEHEQTDGPPGFTSALLLGPAFVAKVGTPAGPNASFPYYYNDTYTDAADRNKVTAGFGDVTVHPITGLDLFAGYRLSRETLDYNYVRSKYSNYPVQYGANFDPNTLSPTTPVTPSAFAGDHSETDWAGRLGGSYEFMPGVRAYATFSRGYVGAGVDLGSASTGTAADPEKALLRPSISKNYEIGIKSELLDHRVRMNAAFFRQDTTNTQITALVPGTNTTIVQNAGDIDAKGIELNAEAQLTRLLDVTLGLAYLDANIENLSQLCYPGQTAAQGCIGGTQNIEGQQALNAPKFKGNTVATYTIPLPSAPFDLYLRGDYEYQSHVYYQLNHDPLAAQGGYGIVNFGIGGVSKSQRYEGRLFIGNIADKYYCLNMVAGAVARQSCQSSPITAQREFGLNLKAKF
jgi:iron complex outermembrane recepter protein